MTTITKKPTRLPRMKDHALIGDAEKLPISAPTPVISVSPVILSAPDRIIDLHLRVSAPITGSELPIILLSHGQGRSNNLSSLNGYSPLANFWAAHGFVVIQPTHLSSKTLSLGADSSSEAPLFWRSRVLDMKIILDQLDKIETAFPQIKGRLDHSRIAVAGHSMGGHTAGMLMGARLIDPENGSVVDLSDARIKVGVLLAAPGNGNGGIGLSQRVLTDYTFFRDYSVAEMATPALVVVGDSDNSTHLSTRGSEWHTDPYHFSKGPKSLLTLVGGKHGLGGVSGYDTAEAVDDESPERLSVVQRVTWAYLRSTLYKDDSVWHAACEAIEKLSALGKVESK